jgi:hypothetical protein
LCARGFQTSRCARSVVRRWVVSSIAGSTSTLSDWRPSHYFYQLQRIPQIYYWNCTFVSIHQIKYHAGGGRQSSWYRNELNLQLYWSIILEAGFNVAFIAILLPAIANKYLWNTSSAERFFIHVFYIRYNHP